MVFGPHRVKGLPGCPRQIDKFSNVINQPVSIKENNSAGIIAGLAGASRKRKKIIIKDYDETTYIEQFSIYGDT